MVSILPVQIRRLSACAMGTSPPVALTDRPTIFSWVMHGPEKLMMPGTASTAVDVLDEWMQQCNLKVPDYPALAYDLLPRDGEVKLWNESGRNFFKEKFSNVQQARAAATKYPTASMKHWANYNGSIRSSSGLHLNANYQIWTPVKAQKSHFTRLRPKEIGDFLRVCDILFVGLLEP